MAITIYEDDQYHLVKQVQFVWTTDSDSGATDTTTYHYDGCIYWVVTVPAGAGSQPTDQYDITLVGEKGLDLLQGNGADRSNVNTEYINVSDGLGAVTNEKLTLTVSSAGEVKTGSVYVYIV